MMVGFDNGVRAMTTFSIVEDASVGASGVSAGDISDVKDIILAAAETWNRYFVQG